MTRIVTAANQTAADGRQQSFGDLVDLNFTSGHQYVTNRAHNVEFGGHTYLAVGYLGNVEVIREDIEKRPQAVRLSISGVDSSLLSLAITDDYAGRNASIYSAWFDENDQLVGTPEGPYIVQMSHANITLGGTNAVSMNCENEFARWKQAKALPYTHETQQRLFSGDEFFDQGPFMRDKIVRWGGARVNSGFNGGGGATGKPRYDRQ